MGNIDLIGSREAEARLQMSRSAFQRAVQNGDVPHAAKLPGHTGAWLFDARVIDALAKNPADAHTDSESGAVA